MLSLYGIPVKYTMIRTKSSVKYGYEYSVKMAWGSWLVNIRMVGVSVYVYSEKNGNIDFYM